MNYQALLHTIYDDIQPLLGQGKVASYIPALASADPHDFGMSISLIDGTSYHVGMSEKRFSIQSYYDPAYASHSLGKYTLLEQIALAKRLGLKWIYLGYYVEQCPSLSYKSDYTPSLQLNGRPEEDEIPIWVHQTLL